MFYRFLFPLVNWFVRLLAHVEVRGAEHMPYGGVLLISNHLTNFDPLIIGMCFKRELHFMAKIELYSNPLTTRLINALGAFPVRRGEADRAALRQAEQLLKEGRVVAIFPEGHRSVAGGVQESKGGIALLARRADAQILPVGITGTEQFRLNELKRWRPWRRPTLTITAGAPFRLPHTSGRADYNALANEMMQRVADVLPPAYRGVYVQKTAV